MTDIYAATLSGGAPGLALRLVAGFRWASDVSRGLRAAARDRRLADEAVVRRITELADARHGHML